jgi:DNA-binding GntR family transcriptional regulator
MDPLDANVVLRERARALKGALEQGERAVAQDAGVHGEVWPLDPVVPSSLTDEIVLRIEKAILEGVYPPGTHLRQDELCERFGVSRTPVRQALRDLQARNLVVLVPNRGATVRVPSRRDAQEVYAVRAELEGFAAELAAARAGSRLDLELAGAEARVVQLASRLQQFGDAAWPAVVEFQIAAGDFHRVLQRACGNERLVATIEHVERSFPMEYVALAIGTSDENQILNIDEHQAISRAIAARDGNGAREAMKNHVLHLGEKVVRYLDDHRFWG